MSSTSVSDENVWHHWLMAAGLVSWGLYVAIALLSGRFALTVPSADRPHVTVFILFGLLFVLYLVALRIAVRLICTRRAMVTIGVFGVRCRSVLLFTTPIQEIDLYRYIWDGNAVACGVSPYRYSPHEVIAASDWSALADATGHTKDADRNGPLPDSPLQRLVTVQRRSPALGGILRTIHFAELRSPYPPVSQAVFAIAAWTTPDTAPVQTHLFVMKAWIVQFDVVTIFVMVALLKVVQLPVGWCLAYAWCPLILKEFANSGHLDAIAVCLTTAALWLLVYGSHHAPRDERLPFEVGSSVTHALSSDPAFITWSVTGPMAAILLALAIGAKLYAVVLLPVCAAWLVRQCGWRAAVLFSAVVGIVSALTLWPMFGHQASRESPVQQPIELQGPPPPPTDLDAGTLPPEDVPSVFDAPSTTTADSASGLSAFLKSWRMNDFLFLIISENLDPSRAELHEPWFAIVPDNVRLAIVSPLMTQFDIDAGEAAFLLTRALLTAVLAVLVAWLSWRVVTMNESTPAPRRCRGAGCFLEACFLTLAWFWLLAPTQNPWYWTWCLPLIPFARSRAWLWVSGLVMAYYLRFWLNAHWPEPPGPFGSRFEGASFFDFVIVWLEYGPFFAALVLSWLFRRRRSEQ